MSILYECDSCDKQEAAQGCSSLLPKNWTKVSLTVRNSNNTKTGIDKVLCLSCAAKYGVTDVQIEDVEKSPEKKLSDYLYEVVETLVEEAMSNQ
jgi:hypothetical protein